MSRHRGAKHRRRYELLGGISLLSPEYLLFVEELLLVREDRSGHTSGVPVVTPVALPGSYVWTG